MEAVMERAKWQYRDLHYSNDLATLAEVWIRTKLLCSLQTRPLAAERHENNHHIQCGVFRTAVSV